MKKLYNRFNNSTFSILIGLVLFCSIDLNAQTGPGGVGTSTNNTLWLDAHTMGGANGGAISSWTDYSGNNIPATQSIIAKQPTFVTGAVNGRSAINFNGTQNMNCGATANMNNVTYIDWYIVSEIDNFSTLSAPFNVDYGSTGPLDAFTGMLLQTGVTSSYARTAAGALIKAAFPVTSGYNVYQGVWNRTAHSVTSNTNFTQNAINLNAYLNSATHEGFNIGGKNTIYRIDGKIAEVFVFNSALNTAQKKILQNYISAKYDIAISSDMFAFEGTHGLGVVGIGRDDASNLHADSQGNGVVRINTPSDMGDGEYLFTGHTDVSLSTFSTDFPPSITDGTRFERTWRVSKTGNVGTVDVTFDLDPTTDFSAANPSEYRLLVDATGVFATADQVLTGTYTAGTNSITFTGVNLSHGDYFTLAGETPQDIHSITSGDWSNPATWDCGCVPSQLNNVFIDPTDIVEVDTDAECINLNVDATAGLTMNSGSNLDLYGNLELYGSFTAATGQLSFVGTIPQFFDDGGNTVILNDLLINNIDPSGVVFFASQYTLNGTLTMVAGTLFLDDPGNVFIINSISSGTEGRIAAIPVGALIVGEVSVRRFIPSGLADWRDICSPVIGATFADWDPDLAMSGDNFPDGCASSGDDPCYESVKYTLNGIENGVLNVTDPITNGRGYNVFMGDDLSTFSGTTLTSTGTVNGSSDIVKVIGSGWQTLGNPYVSQMLYSSTTRTSQISNYFYVYDASIGDYQWYDGASGTASIPELNSGLMAIGQSVWIYTTSAGGTMTYHQSDKTTANATYIRTQEEETADNNLYLKLREHNSTFESSIMLSVSDYGNDGLDSLMDMRLLVNGHETASRLSIVSDNVSLKKNYIRNDARNKAFNLNTNIKRAGYYSLELSNFESFIEYRHILLYDAETNEFIDLKQDLTYTFYSDVFDGNRFTLILTNEETSEASTVQSLTVNESDVTEESLTITQMGHTFNVVVSETLTSDSQVRLVNVLGQTEVYSTNVQFIEGSNLISVPSELYGVHILIITTGDRVLTKKVVL